MFVIAEFTSDDNSVEVIPSNWLRNVNQCYWPPQKFKNDIRNFIKRQILPQNTWPIYPINILSKAATYDEARHKAAKAKEGVEKLTSDPEDYGRGRRTQKRSTEFLLDSSDESPDDPTNKMMKLIHDLPSIPSIPDMHQAHCSNSKEVDPDQVESVQAQAESPSLLQDVFQEQIPQSKSHINPYEKASTPHSAKPHKKDVLELILRNQKYMQLEIRALKDAVDRLIEHNLNTCKTENAEKPDLGSFPLVDIISLNNLEEKLLNNSGEQVYLVKKMRSFGGSTFQEHARRILRFLFRNELAEQYSWQGSGEKKKFSSLLVSKLIVDAVCEEKSVDRASVEDIIKTWLRHAKERKNYVAKKDIKL